MNSSLSLNIFHIIFHTSLINVKTTNYSVFINYFISFGLHFSSVSFSCYYHYSNYYPVYHQQHYRHSHYCQTSLDHHHDPSNNHFMLLCIFFTLKINSRSYPYYIHTFCLPCSRSSLCFFYLNTVSNPLLQWVEERK